MKRIPFSGPKRLSRDASWLRRDSLQARDHEGGNTAQGEPVKSEKSMMMKFQLMKCSPRMTIEW